VPHFQLVTTDGDALGARELGRMAWPPGSVIDVGPDQPDLRVIHILETNDEHHDDPEWFPVLVVEPADKQARDAPLRGKSAPPGEPSVPD